MWKYAYDLNWRLFDLRSGSQTSYDVTQEAKP